MSPGASLSQPALAEDSRIFCEARDKFLDSLPMQERSRFSKCASIEQLLAEIKEPEAFRKKHKEWTKTMGRVKEFCDCLQPYFEIANITIQSHPEWTAIAWGAFRLILQLACNFSTFFSRLADLLDQIRLKMPHFADLLQHGQRHVSQEFRSSLRSFYVDLFDFFQSVALVFTQKNGKIRKAPMVISKLLFQPFDVRFGQFCKKLETYDRILEHEQESVQLKFASSTSEEQIAEHQAAADFRDETRVHFDLVRKMEQKMTKEDFDKKVTNVQEWLNYPPDYMEKLRHSQSLREDSTAEWIFEEPSFLNWRNKLVDSTAGESYERLLWVKGKPGSGKTVLAAAIVQELTDTVTADGRLFVFSYFFSYEYASKQGMGSLSRSVLAQILQQCHNDPEIFNIFSFVTRDTGKSSSGSKKDLEQLLNVVLRRLHEVYIVIDGLDECGDPDGCLCDLMLALEGCTTKLIIFSRPNIERLLEVDDPNSVITITHDSNHRDIRRYLAPRLEMLQKKHLPPGTRTEDLLDHLLLGANGMFLWGRLMIEYLKSPAHTPSLRLAAIQNLQSPGTLDDMYIRILRMIGTTIREEQELARSIIFWIVYGHKSLTGQQLQCVVTPRKLGSALQNMETDHSSDSFTNFEHTVVIICASLVEVGRGRYRLIHKSAYDFFMDCSDTARSLDRPDDPEREIPRRFLTTRPAIHAEFADACLTYLLFEGPGHPLSGDMRRSISIDEVATKYVFLAYASTQWMHHLSASATKTSAPHKGRNEDFNAKLAGLQRTLSRFLSSKLILMSWVESIYLCMLKRERDQLFNAMKNVPLLITSEELYTLRSSTLEPAEPLGRELADFAKDLITIDEDWGDKLQKSPHFIWQDITAFHPSRFLAQTRATSFVSMSAQRPYGIQSTKPLSTISEEANEGQDIAVLSIWPSRSYEILWSDVISGRSSFEIQDQCAGWIAKFSIWSTVSSKHQLVSDHHFDLAQEEIEAQIEHFMALVRRKSQLRCHWALPFPTSIAPDLQSFTVLRTVFLRVNDDPMTPNNCLGTLNGWQQILVPLDTLGAFSAANDPVQQGSSSQGAKRKASNLVVSHSYDLKIGGDARFLLYSDKVSINLHGNGKVSSAIAIFELERSGTAWKYHLRGQIGGGDGAAQLSFRFCSFHPQLPLLLFFCRSLSSQSRIGLWSFATVRDSVVFDNESTISYPCSVTKPSVESLDFSACGTQIVFRYTAARFSEVLSIEQDPAYRSAQTNQNQAADWRMCFHMDSTSSPNLTPKMEDSLTHLPTSTQLSHLHYSNHNDTTTLNKVIYQPGKGQRNVEVLHRSEGLESRQSLVSLPRWAGIEKLNISVHHPPAEDEDRINIVLNKPSQDFYFLEDDADNHFPAVLRKDVRALQAPQRRTPASRLALTGRSNSKMPKPESRA